MASQLLSSHYLRIFDTILRVTPGDKLAAFRHAQPPRGWSQADLAKVLSDAGALGLDPASWRARISSYELGAANLPKKVLDALVKVTGVPESWWLDGRDSPVPLPNATVIQRSVAPESANSLGRGDLVQLPLWRAVGGLVTDQEVFFEETLEFYAVPAFLVGPDLDTYRIVQVSGFSMAPRIESGSLLVVKLTSVMPAPGVISVVQDAENRLYCKVFRRANGGQPELHSINGEYPVIPANDLRGWQVRAFGVGIMHAYDQPGPNIEWDGGRPLRA